MSAAPPSVDESGLMDLSLGLFTFAKPALENSG
jgi:hypothetical protein